MNRKKKLLRRLFFALFTISVSLAVLPCGIINVHGLFGEVTAFFAAEDEEQENAELRDVRQEKAQRTKGIRFFNRWFEILPTVICICFLANLCRLPRSETIVTLKVRMDD